MDEQNTPDIGHDERSPCVRRSPQLNPPPLPSPVFLFPVIVPTQSSPNAKPAKKKQCRKRYSIKQKLAFLRRVDRLLTCNPDLSLNKASAELEISPSLIVKWRKDYDKLSYFRSLNVCSLTPTPKSDLADIEKKTDGNFCS